MQTLDSKSFSKESRIKLLKKRKKATLSRARATDPWSPGVKSLPLRPLVHPTTYNLPSILYLIKAILVVSQNLTTTTELSKLLLHFALQRFIIFGLLNR